MTVIYMDKNMKLIQPTSEHQKLDRATWCPDSVIGEIINTPLNPILY